VRILPGQICVDLTGASMADQMSLGIRTWGNSAAGSTALLTGTYQGDGEVSRRLLSALPRILLLRADEWDSPIVPVLADEVTKDDVGQEAVLDRLLDVLLVSVLRAWFARAGSDAPSWYAAQRDPVVGPALRLLENHPQRLVDGRGSGAVQWRLAGHPGQTLHRRRRRAADRLPHRMAAGPRRRPPPRARDDRGPRGGARSGTAARSRSAPRSNAAMATAPRSTAVAPL
jgi:hypothetical protein